MSARAVANVYEPAQPRQPSSAPRETRTPTGHTAHKALNLARLPIPPQARDGAEYKGPFRNSRAQPPAGRAGVWDGNLGPGRTAGHRADRVSCSRPTAPL